MVLRRAARKAKVIVRTSVDGRRTPPCHFPHGLPAHEPWRGAAIHAYESGIMDELTADAIGRALRRRQ